LAPANRYATGAASALRRTTTGAPPRTTTGAFRAGATAFLLTLVLAAFFVGGCGSAPDTKIVIIGIDGMDWSLADPLIEQGKMPNLARVISEGTRAELHSLIPLQKSPTIWTTMATGKGPRKHGIGDFVEGSDEQPLLNSTGWRARSIWDILGENGYTVGVVGWLVTWPVREVNGYCVTDRIVYAPEDGFSNIPHLTYPAELEEELAPLRVSHAVTTMDDIADLMTGDVWKGGEEAITWGGVQNVRSICANDESIREMSEHLLESREQPDFYAVYFLGLDRCCHRFWGPMRPYTVDIKTDERINEAFQNVIPRYYERVDSLIGDVLDSIDENSTVIVCSDHGFRGPLRTKEGLQLGILMHRELGILAAMGPGIRRGGTLANANVLDLTPTVLALLGEPVGRDMDGFVLTDLIDEGHLADYPVTYIDTYESDDEPEQPEEPIESALDDEIKEELRSLGYIE